MPEKSNIWRDCVDGYHDWVKEHIEEVGRPAMRALRAAPPPVPRYAHPLTRASHPQGAPLNESDHCGDPPLLLAAGNGHLSCCRLLLEEGADIEQRNVVRIHSLACDCIHTAA